ncbi:hypothetical protein GCM10020220_084090 [Nonomuraea rubra]
MLITEMLPVPGSSGGGWTAGSSARSCGWAASYGPPPVIRLPRRTAPGVLPDWKHAYHREEAPDG